MIIKMKIPSTKLQNALVKMMLKNTALLDMQSG